MNLLQKTKWIIALIVVAIGMFAVGTVSACCTSGTGYFATNQMYRCAGGPYFSAANQNASAKWSATTDLDTYASCSGSTNVWTYGDDYDLGDISGYSEPCASGGVCGDAAFNSTYITCTTYLDNVYMTANSYTSLQKQKTATHELGHCWSLAHDSRTYSVMRQGQLSTIDPDTENISEVNGRY